eukprot:scpid17761/ scgid26939/ Probable glutathione S-transferase; Auxin-induced protein PCNT107
MNQAQAASRSVAEQAVKLKLFSAWFCPFAQRTWIGLLHKEVPFDYVEVDPYAKPKELLAVSPEGLVPALVDADGRSVHESLITLEFLEDAFPNLGKPILPADPITRAQARIWSDFCQKKIIPTFYRMLQKRDEVERETARRDMLDSVRTLTKAMERLSDQGPFFMGEDFGLVDIVVSPWVERFYILKHHRGFQVPGSINDKDGEFYRFHKWWKAVQGVPAFKGTTCDRDKLLATYQRYADDTATSMVAVAMRTGRPLP